MSIIKLENINKTYGSGEVSVNALKGINLTIEEGDFLSIMGPSGCGKSTLLNIIGCIDKPTDGEYLLADKPTSKLSFNELATTRNEQISFIFQNFALINNLTVIDNVMLPLMIRSISKKKMKEKALNILSKLDILDKKDKKVSQISGGQQQRVAIARSLVQESKIILGDEPTGSLDQENGEIIMNLLKELSEKEGKTIIVVTHDSKVSEFSSKKIVMKDGLVV
ncbi:ABC transporter ATP-binding protein [Clostridium sp. YIM B02505]|uniref:ABC transporter ATP-binding protein n=1 Tax=Clostridium yunnanense TaxID=2800325 RepID=A0ABS1EQZ4_9CLOT|nr:ABC transporter ATP-binding protein [Clostridium yunnanense]MBK1811760.1 ABC transporter ATP-binding protein [Clostridium yunnanense]